MPPQILLNIIMHKLNVRMIKKFWAGHDAHGGDLQDKTVLELLYESLDEKIDDIFYTMTAIMKLEKDEK
jgi:hypothetical protein